jgi:NADH dehydrogenase
MMIGQAANWLPTGRTTPTPLPKQPVGSAFALRKAAIPPIFRPKREPPMRARIYQPARTAMQSGTAKTHQWVLDYAPATAREVDPLMGWTMTDDTQAQVRLRFDSREAALAYARANGIDAEVVEPKGRALNIRARGYGENFATDRKGAWTH